MTWRQRWSIGCAMAALALGGALVAAPARAASTGALAGGATLELAVGGSNGIPADAEAAVLNVTVTGAEGPGYLTVWPCGQTRPTASNLNYVTGDTVPNLVVATLGIGGRVCIYAQTTTDVVADVTGWFPAGADYTPLTPRRLLDTRDGAGTPVPGDGTIELAVGGTNGIPTTAEAAVVNMTVTDPAGPGYLTVWPCGQTRPTASNLNYVTGDTVPNLVVATLGTNGRICIYAQTTTHVVADVTGWFPNGADYTPLTPRRLLDTRDGAGTPVPGDGTIELAVGGTNGIPTTAEAAVVNMTVTDPAGPGYLTVWPCGQTRPTASNLNYVTGDTVPNLVVATLGTNGRICIYAQTTTHVVADVTGWFPNGADYTPLTPRRLLDTRVGAKVTPIISVVQSTFTYPAGPIDLGAAFAVVPAVHLQYQAVDATTAPNGPHCTVDSAGRLVMANETFLALPHTCRVTASAPETAATTATARTVDIVVDRRAVDLDIVGVPSVAPAVGGFHDVSFRLRFDPPIIENVEVEPGKPVCDPLQNFSAQRDPAKPAEFVVTARVAAVADPAQKTCTIPVRNSQQDQVLGTASRNVPITRP